MHVGFGFSGSLASITTGAVRFGKESNVHLAIHVLLVGMMF